MVQLSDSNHFLLARYDKELEQVDGTLATIEQQREALEGASTNTAVLNTITDAARSLKKANNELDVDKVQDMMEDVAEQQGIAREISEAISSPAAFGQVTPPHLLLLTPDSLVQEFDEDELAAELAALDAEVEEEEQEQLDRELLGVAPTTGLPALPAGPTKARAKEALELEELAAWAS